MGKNQGNLFGEAMTAVPKDEMSHIVVKLRKKRIRVQLKGRGACTLYVNTELTACLQVRRTAKRNGRWMRTFKRHGAFGPRELDFLRKLDPSL